MSDRKKLQKSIAAITPDASPEVLEEMAKIMDRHLSSITERRPIDSAESRRVAAEMVEVYCRSKEDS